MWEKHWKEGREDEEYQEGSGFEAYHDRQALGMTFRTSQKDMDVTFYEFGYDWQGSCRSVESNLTKIYEKYFFSCHVIVNYPGSFCRRQQQLEDPSISIGWFTTTTSTPGFAGGAIMIHSITIRATSSSIW